VTAASPFEARARCCRQHDATNISFTGAQSALIEQVAAAAKKPVVVLVLSATPLDLSAVLANPKVGAVLHLGVPSVTVLGVSAVLYGDESPAARTVQTFYNSSYQDQISIFVSLYFHSAAPGIWRHTLTARRLGAGLWYAARTQRLRTAGLPLPTGE